MLWSVCVALLVLWLVGVTAPYTLGGFLHILFFLAAVALVIRLVQHRQIFS
jgi:hypothetical protein